MKKQLLSIAMATYNGEQFLREQLESIFYQTYKELELIIYNDNSIYTILHVKTIQNKQKNFIQDIKKFQYE